MSSENSISRANGITYPGLKDEVLIDDGSLTAIRNIHRSSIPEKASNSPGKGAGSTNTTSHSAKPASFQTGEPGDGVFADKYLLTHTDGPNHTFIGVPVEPILPTGHRRPTKLEEPIKSQLLSLAHDHKSDLATAVLIAWTVVLSRLSGQESIVVDVGGTFGKGTWIDPFTMNVDLSGELNTSKLFERVKQSFGTTGARQSAVRESASLSKNDDEPHLSQASFFAHAGNITQPLGDQVSKQRCLELHLLQDKDTVTMNVLPATSLYNKETIERYAGYLEAVLKNMVANKSQPFALFDILCPEEKKLLLETWNTINQPYPVNTCLHQLFEKQAELSPEAIAIVHHDQMLTYRELNSWANWIAFQLVEAGVQPGDYVMLLLDRSIDLVASQIAILKIGAAYVPIDTRAPVDRQVYIASDCGSMILVTDKSTDIPPAIQGTVLRVSANQMHTKHDQESFESPTTSSQDTACVMYTSGSTGRPKGVMVPHRGIARLAINNGYSDIGKDDRVAFVANPAFDHSSYEVWVPLLNGARIVIIDRETLLQPHRLAAAIDHHQITMLFLTTALLHQYVHIIGPALSKLRYLMGAGEQGHVEAFTEVAKHGGRVCVINTYGPTEASVTSTAYRITSTTSQLRRLPIGRPISNTPQYVLDSHQRPVPTGVVGELYIGGPGVANGYLNRPDLTAERFLPDPFAKVQGARMYRTGDLVRYLPDGNMVFVGRNDNQVKIRGFRVELGEIEARLAEHSQVHEAVVLSLGEGGKDSRLVAYVASAPQEHLVQTLYEYLSGVLPEYMIPSAFVRMDVFPLTNNGKIDRHALPDPGSDSLVASGYVAPQGEHEIALAAVWSDLLNVERVGRHDNFFMLGGHSLLAVRMIEHLRRQGYRLSVRALFESPVLFTLTTCLRDEQIEAVIPPNVISPATKALTPDMLPLINLNQADIDLVAHQTPGGVANIQDIYALSPLQDGILFHHMMAASGDLYLNSLFRVFRDKDPLDRYLGAFQKVADRHDSLRTAIMWENLSTPAQVVLRQATVSVIEHSLDPLDGPIIDQLKHIYSPQTYRIELREAPLTRFAYAQDVDGRWVLLHLLHHLIGDHSTLEIMEEEIDAILGGRIESLPAPQSIRNLIGKIRLSISVEEHERYFHKVLHDIDSPSLPYGLSDVYGDGCNVVEYHCMLPQDLNNKLRRHAKRLGVSLASLCHLAWAQVIAATSGQSKVVFGTVLFGRMQGGAGSDRAMGLLINTLPMRVDVQGVSVQESVRQVQADLAGLLEHEYASLAVAQRCSGVPSGMPLFSAILNYRHNSNPNQRETARIGEENISEHERTNYPVVMSVEDFGTSLGLTAQVVQPCEPSTMCGYMQQALHNLAELLEKSPDTPIQELSVLPAEEYELVVRTWNNIDAPYPSDRGVHQLFEDRAERRPDAVAIQHGDRSLTYRTLNNCASHLARKLVALGVRPGDYVAMLLERSFELIISQLAILKIGAAYVPIDIQAPVERQAYIMSDCGAQLLITDEHTDVPAVFNSSIFRFCLNDASDMQDTFDISLHSRWSGLHTAYVMYTSGSTGRPKGVMVPHRGVVRLAINNGYADVGIDDRVAFVSNPTFDASTFDVWVTLLKGACVVIIDRETLLDPPRLAVALDYHQVTWLFLTTALLHQYVYIIGPALSKLRYLMGAGEQGLVEAYTEVAKHGGRVCVINTYGPTEASVTSTTYPITSTTSQLRRLPIGRPISNTPQYVLDTHQRPVPIGVVGELYIGGPGVANGYLNRPDLTAERFLPDPFARVPDARMYRTGDLVRYLPDGNLVFVGRNDNQVKVRGFRVELGEIEARLVEHTQVRDAVVLILGDSSDNKRLVAYIEAVPDESLGRTLREYLSVRLPEYMIPSAFVRLDVFPLTNNGKIDRRALPAPSSDSLATSDYVAPQGDLEIALAAIWSDLLNVEQVGRHDNFFMLGGHSLLAVRLMNRVLDFGVHMALSTLFSSPTLCALGEALESSANLQGSTHPVIVLVARDSLLELSFAQQRLWFLAQMDGLSEVYHVPFASRLRGPLNHDALKKTLNALFCRHESLRTVFVAIDGHPQVQLLPPDNDFPLVIRDLRGEQDGEAIAKQLAAQESRTPFDLENGLLVRSQLIQLADDEHLFLITMHHIVTDGWSMGVMIRELSMLYGAYSSGLHNPLTPLSIQYPDYAVWQRQWLKQDKLQDQAAYWRENLAGAPAYIELPTDRPRPHQQSFSGASVPIRFDSQLTSALKSLSQMHGVTMFMTTLAAWSTVLSRLSGQDDIVIGTPSANRNHQQLEQLIGFFVSTLVLRIDLSEEPSAIQLLERVRKTAIAAQAHQDIPFEQVVEIVQPPRRTDMTPLFQVMFAWQDEDHDSLTLHGIETISEDIHYDISKFELELTLGEHNGEIAGDLIYSTALFDRETINRHIGYLEIMLRWMTDSTGESIGKAPILGTSERELLFETWNTINQPYPGNTCLHQLFEKQVELSPQAIAIVHHDQMLTYRELNSWANWIAFQLVEAGVKPGDYVMLLLDRSIDLVASQIAILKIGAAYVPIDTRAPVDRQVYIASDCGSMILITDKSTDIPPEMQGTVLRVSANQMHTKHDQESFESPTTSSQDTACVMYTSGSTGRPKGVMVPHRGIARLAINNGYSDIGKDDRVAFVANPAFDHNSYEVWVPLLNGARIVIIDRETLLQPHRLAAAIDHHQITMLFLTTALLHQYVHIIGPALSKLRYLMGAGEQGHVEAFTEVAKHGGRVCVINTYGPTEASVTSTAYRITSTTSQLRRLPIGRPISNTPQYVLDSHQRPVPTGVVGELYIGGPGVANGYLNRPDLTAERFLPDPFARVPDARMYRTGDMVHYMPDGNLVFVGRNDNQVKVRGFRVEPGEIETCLIEHPQVREAVVLVIGEGSDDKRLVAYIVAKPHENLVRKLREYLSGSLPEYMIPSAFVRLDAFPLTNNGKIDRRALPDPERDSVVTCDYVAPQGEHEIALAKMWSDLLKVERVGRHDNFFTLGGHSLLAVRMINIVRSSLGVDLKLHVLFSTPTVADLATNLVHGYVNNAQDDEYSVLIPLKTQGCRAPLFCVHSGLGLSWSYRGLAQNLHPEQPLYGLQARGLDGKSPLATSVEEMTLDYIDHIRNIQPQGPYHLLGWSFGGKIAHNMAVELQRQGDTVSLLAILDTIPGDSGEEVAESNFQDEGEDYDELVDGVVGDSSADDALAFKKSARLIYFNCVRLSRSFAPSVYNGDILFFRATVPYQVGKQLIDPSCWRPYTRGDIEVHDVECKHEDMKTSKNLAVVAHIVAEKLY